MKYYRDCIACNGEGKVYTDSYCKNVKGILREYCKDCNGEGITDCTEYVNELIKQSKNKDQLAISVRCFIDELKEFGLSD